ncbi:hypothetical protein GJ496_004835 [Pomphorhynchus laevis]|nr:hypothetical protein GJ496_004835 [Pomphorhynchus laevis]
MISRYDFLYCDKQKKKPVAKGDNATSSKKSIKKATVAAAIPPANVEVVKESRRQNDGVGRPAQLPPNQHQQSPVHQKDDKQKMTPSEIRSTNKAEDDMLALDGFQESVSKDHDHVFGRGKAGQQNESFVNEASNQQFVRGARSARTARGSSGYSGSGPTRRRDVDASSSGGFDTVTFRRGGRGGRFADGDGSRGNREYGGGRGGFYRGGGQYNQQAQFEQPQEIDPSVAGFVGEVQHVPQSKPPFRGRGRFGASNFDNASGNKRQFDRHSGNHQTSFRPEEKRHGGGAYNWGKPVEDNMNDSIVDNPSDSAERPEDTLPDGDVPVGAIEDTEQFDRQQTRSPSPVQMTLDEYREQQRKNKLGTKGSVRQAGEGEDEKRWGKHTQVYRKKPREETKYTIAQDVVSSSEDDEGHLVEVEDEESHLTKQIVSSLFVGKPAPSNRQSRGGRGFRGANRGGAEGSREFSSGGRGRGGSFASGGNEFTNSRGRNNRGGGFGSNYGSQRGDFNSTDFNSTDIREFNHQQHNPHSRHQDEKLPDMSDFPKLC